MLLVTHPKKIYEMYAIPGSPIAHTLSFLDS